MSSPLGEPEASLLVDLDNERNAVSVAALAERVASGTGTSHVVGVQGSAGALVARALRTRTGRPVVYVTTDFETARHATDDLAFFASGAAGLEATADAPVLLFTPSETNPYSDIHPERQ